MRALGAALRIAGRLVRALFALALLAGLLGGLPWLLVTWIGWPLPDHLPTLDETSTALTTSVDDGRLLNVLAVVAWILWALFLRDVAVAAIEAAIDLSEARQGRTRVPRPTRDPIRLAATVLIGTVIGAVLLGPLRGAAGTRAPGGIDAAHAATRPPVAAATAAPHTATTTKDADPVVAAGPASATRPPTRPAVATIPSTPSMSTTATAGSMTSGIPGWARDAPGGTYTVRDGDNLWDIAAAHLGDPFRWREIYVLNRHQPQHNGYALTDPDQIHIGWTLALPARTTVPPPESSPPPSADEPAPPSPDGDVAPESSAPPPDRPEELPPPTTPAPTPSAGAFPGDDGIAGPPPTPTTQAPSTTSISPLPSHTAGHPAPAPDRTANPGPPGITLTGNSWVDLGLATAIANAAALIWAHRRRRYQPRPPTPQLRLDDPDMAPLPGIVNQIRHRLRHRAEGAATEREAEAAVQHAAGRAETGAQVTDEVEPHHAEDGAVPAPVIPALAGPLAPVWPPAGLGLTGPGGEAAARGFLIATLATGTPEDMDSPGEVVIPAVTLATLLGAGAVDVPDIPRLTVTDGLPEALDVLEEQTLRRSRLVYAYEADNVETLRRVAPDEEPLPPVVLLADATAAHERARIAALLTQGQRLDLHGILLGPWRDGDTVTVAADGTTTPAGTDTARHGAHPADIGRLTVLTPDHTNDLLRTLPEAHTGQRQGAVADRTNPAARSPAEPTASDPTDSGADAATPAGDGDGDHSAAPRTDPSGGRPPRQRITLRDAEAATTPGIPAPRNGHPSAAPGDQPQPDGATPPTGTPTEPDHAENFPDEPTRDGDTPARRSDVDSRPDAAAEAVDRDQAGHATTSAANNHRARVHVLGPPRIHGYSPPRGQAIRKKSLELLVYLAVHGGSATQDAILEDVLAYALRSTADAQLHTNVYGLRRALKHAAGDAQHLTHTGNRYALDPDLVEVDLWNMQATIADADATTDRAARIAALRRAVEQYHGALAQDCEYEWVEPHREAARQQALDTHRALAAELAAHQPEDALAVLDTAIGHSPYADPLYQDAMRIHHQLGDLDGIRARHRDLTLRLKEIDTDPTDDAERLAAQLIADLQNRASRRSSGTSDTQ